MAVIHDLIGATQNSTGASSAQLSHPEVKENPQNAFVQMLLKYATPAANTINSTVGNTLNDLSNTFQAPFKDIGAYTRIQMDPKAKQQLDQINNNKSLTPDQKEQMGNTLMQQHGGQTPTQSASAESGANFGANLLVPAANGNIPIHSPLPGTVEGITRQGTQVANDANKAAQEAMAVAKTQPGGLQAGFLNLGEDAAKTEKAATSAKPPMITKAKADPQAIAKYNLIFDVTRQRAHNMLVHPETVINQLIDDGVTNVRSLDDLQQVARNTTGEGGAFPMINNYILGKIANPLDYSVVSDFKNTHLPAVLKGEKDGFIYEINKEIEQAMKPLNYNRPGELPSTLPENHAFATDLYQTSQNLRDIAMMYKRKAYTQMGELTHPEMERASDAIMEMKNNVDDVINEAVPSHAYEAFKKDPFVQQQLQRIPPKVAERWLNGAEKFKDGQTIQAPYVNLDKMIQDTKDTQLSVWTKAAKAMQGQSRSGQVADAITSNLNPKTAAQNLVGGAIQKVLSPFDKSAADIFAENTSGQSASMKPSVGSGVKKIVAGAALTGGVAAGANMMQDKSNAQSNDSTNNPEKSHNEQIVAGRVTDVNSLPQPKDVKPDTAIPHPSQITGANGSLAVSDDQYNKTISELEALKQDPSYQVFPKSEQLQAAIQAVTNKHDQSKPLLDKYEMVNSLDQKIGQAKELLKKTSPGAWNALPLIGGVAQGLQSSFDPTYKQLMIDFNAIENTYPGLKGSLTNLGSAESARKALDQARMMIVNDYLNSVRNYSGGSTATTPPPTTQTAPSNQLPTIGGSSIGGSGGTVGGDSSTPLAAF